MSVHAWIGCRTTQIYKNKFYYTATVEWLFPSVLVFDLAMWLSVDPNASGQRSLRTMTM